MTFSKIIIGLYNYHTLGCFWQVRVLLEKFQSVCRWIWMAEDVSPIFEVTKLNLLSTISYHIMLFMKNLLINQSINFFNDSGW